MADFFDTYSDEGGSGFLSQDERKALIKSQTPFEITEIILDLENVFEGKKQPRYVLSIVVEGDELNDEGEVKVRKIGFAQGSTSGETSRDRQLEAMMVWLRDPNNPRPSVFIEKVGSFQLLRNANAEASE